MSCPGGCVGGGGQPKTHDPLAVAKRARAIYSIDEASTVRKSHENPSIVKIYEVRARCARCALASESRGAGRPGLAGVGSLGWRGALCRRRGTRDGGRT